MLHVRFIGSSPPWMTGLKCVSCAYDLSFEVGGEGRVGVGETADFKISRYGGIGDGDVVDFYIDVVDLAVGLLSSGEAGTGAEE